MADAGDAGGGVCVFTSVLVLSLTLATLTLSGSVSLSLLLLLLLLLLDERKVLLLVIWHSLHNTVLPIILIQFFMNYCERCCATLASLEG